MNALAHLLSQRECEVMMGLAEGLSPTEVADVMRISNKTVAEYRRRAAVNIGATNTLHAIALWVRAEDPVTHRRIKMTAGELLKAVYAIAQEDVRKAQN